jgi:hypothetical protein
MDVTLQNRKKSAELNRLSLVASTNVNAVILQHLMALSGPMKVCETYRILLASNHRTIRIYLWSLMIKLHLMLLTKQKKGEHFSQELIHYKRWYLVLGKG